MMEFPFILLKDRIMLVIKPPMVGIKH